MKVERIDHIHIIVKDLEAAASFFSSMMGTTFVGPRDTGLGFKVAFDNLGLEIMQPISSGNPVAEHLEKYGEGVSSIGLKVPNIEEAIVELEAKGISVKRWREVWKGDIKGVRIEASEKTHGVEFELIEYKNVQPVTVANLQKLGDLPWM